MRDLRDYSLLHHNTFGIKARCRRFVEFDSVEELQEFALSLRPDDQPLLTIGAGSNLLLTKDFEGTVLHSAIRGITRLPEAQEGMVLLRVGSGETWDEVVDYCVAHGWYGAENLSLIPGEVGASAVQNIGAYGAEVKDIIYKVEAVELSSGRLVTIAGEDCGYAYRQSRFKGEWAGKYVITHVVYRLSATFTPHTAYGNIRAELDRQGIGIPTPQQLRDTIIAIRRDKLPDPAVTGNAGSFFMNPVVSEQHYEQLAARYPDMPHYPVGDGRQKIPAAWLIDQCGWKGKAVGAAGVHSRQPLVLVNLGGATGADITALCRRIQHDVSQQFGIDIHPEVNIV
jgi:UDP-N-acetylmuramate dehydrogenase